jgi:hypothetical protein
MATTDDSFLGALFGSFFRWWWAVLTGFASILSWVYTPDTLTLTRGQVASITLIGFFLLFFAVSTIYQGWKIFKRRTSVSTVVAFRQSENYEGEGVFLISNVQQTFRGKAAELRRTVDGLEVPFAVVEFVDFNAQGLCQANAIWISPNHLRELRTGRFVLSDVVVDPLMTYRTLLTARIGAAV